MLTAIRAKKLFDGHTDRPLANRIVVVRERRIEGVLTGDPALPIEADWLDAEILTPGFVDLQINGAGDIFFNDAPTASSIAKIGAAARQGGCAHLLPTFITANGDAYFEAIDATVAAIENRMPGLLGLHLEGPFLSPKRPGIHEASAIRPIENRDLDLLTGHQAGMRLITIAPEEQPAGVIERLVDAGWIVFAGHSEATRSDMQRAKDAGLQGVTHLFNAMSQMMPREPGIVGSVFDDESLFAGIIADGHHVHPANLRLAVNQLGAERLCLVTDAMPTLFGEKKAFQIGGKMIQLSNGRLADGEGRLAGAHLSMAGAVQNLVEMTDASLAEALTMASRTPARALGLGDQLGRIDKGYRASLTFLDDGLQCTGVMIDGQWFPQRPSG